VDNLVLPENIVSMEVYGRATNIPSEFLSIDGCAAVIIWTTERWPELAAPQVGKQPPPRR
jgi:hypothetical protein